MEYILTGLPAIRRYNTIVSTICYAILGQFQDFGVTDVRNNIITGAVCWAIDVNGGGGLAEYNCFYNNANGNALLSISSGLGNFVADPQFISTGGDEHLLQTNSPCINSGDPSPVFYDSDGKMFAHVELCFQCGNVASSPEGLPKVEWDWKMISDILKELDIPILHKNEEYTALFKRKSKTEPRRLE